MSGSSSTLQHAGLWSLVALVVFSAAIVAAMYAVDHHERTADNANPWEGFVWPRTEYPEPANLDDTLARIAMYQALVTTYPSREVARGQSPVIADPAPLPLQIKAPTNPYRMTLAELLDSARPAALPATTDTVFVGAHRAPEPVLALAAA